MFDGPKPHVGGPVATGSPDVFIEGKPAARLGDQLVCAGPPDAFVGGSPSVFINGIPACRIIDPLAHGGKIPMGALITNIGEGPPQNGSCRDCMKAAAKSGSATVG
jgi:uncharacterized Zn-binding protein involved in type VI secretion